MYIYIYIYYIYIYAFAIKYISVFSYIDNLCIIIILLDSRKDESMMISYIDDDDSGDIYFDSIDIDCFYKHHVQQHHDYDDRYYRKFVQFNIDRDLLNNSYRCLKSTDPQCSGVEITGILINVTGRHHHHRHDDDDVDDASKLIYKDMKNVLLIKERLPLLKDDDDNDRFIDDDKGDVHVLDGDFRGDNKMYYKLLISEMKLINDDDNNNDNDSDDDDDKGCNEDFYSDDDNDDYHNGCKHIRKKNNAIKVDHNDDHNINEHVDIGEYYKINTEKKYLFFHDNHHD